MRSTGATGVNADSSRSHAILQLEVKVVNTAESRGRYDLEVHGTHCSGPYLLWCGPGVKAPESNPLVLPPAPGLQHCSSDGF